VQRRLPQFRFMLRTDVMDYYASLDHELLLEQLARRIKDRFLMNLPVQYLRRSVDDGGNYREVRRGIARGCALSPLIGAFYLKALDEALHRHGLYYVRYMDDIVVLAPTRWRLREAVRVLQQGFADLRLATHPDKTFIGRIERGFDFLGYRYSRGLLRLAAQTARHFGERLLRLYEQ